MLGIERLHDRLAGALAAPGAARRPGSATETCARRRGSRQGQARRRRKRRRRASRAGNRAPWRSSACRRGRRARRPRNGDSSDASAPLRRTESRSTRPIRASGNRSRELLLDLLGAEPGVLEIWGRALAAGLRHHHRVVAVVAARAPSVARAMHGQRDAAVRALEGVAALPAEHRRRIAAPVQQHERPARAAPDDRAIAGSEVAADDDVRPLVGVLVAHVDDAHRRQRPIEDAPLQRRARVFAGHARSDTSPSTASPSRARPARLHAWRARSRRRVRDNAASLPACRTCRAPRPRRSSPSRVERREHRRPRADDEVHVAAADAVPLIVTLAVGERAVLNRHAIAERAAEQRRHRRRQRDLRHQQQHLPAGAPDRLRQAQIDLRLAAAGDAVQQRDPELARVGERAQLLERARLLRRSADGRESGTRPAMRRALERIAVVGFVAQARRVHARRAEPARPRSRRGRASSTGAAPRRRARALRAPRHAAWAGQAASPAPATSGAASASPCAPSTRSPCARLEGRRARAARARRHRHRHRIADAGQVILRHPLAQLDDAGGRNASRSSTSTMSLSVSGAPSVAAA